MSATPVLSFVPIDPGCIETARVGHEVLQHSMGEMGSADRSAVREPKLVGGQDRSVGAWHQPSNTALLKEFVRPVQESGTLGCGDGGTVPPDIELVPVRAQPCGLFEHQLDGLAVVRVRRQPGSMPGDFHDMGHEFVGSELDQRIIQEWRDNRQSAGTTGDHDGLVRATAHARILADALSPVG